MNPSPYPPRCSVMEWHGSLLSMAVARGLPRQLHLQQCYQHGTGRCTSEPVWP